jgi:uncharacterized protein YceK
MKRFCLVFMMLTLSGCATTFTGNAHLEKADCVQKCKSWGMSLAGMVAMGEYSDACVCKAPTGGSASLDQELDLHFAAASTASGATGVVMQARRAKSASAASGASFH